MAICGPVSAASARQRRWAPRGDHDFYVEPATVLQSSRVGGAHSHLFEVGEEIGFDGENHVRVWVENGNVTSIYPEVP